MNKRIIAIFSALFILAGFAGAASDYAKPGNAELSGESPDSKWTAGFGQVEIQIPDTDKPLYIAGYRNGYEITGVYDNQCASAVWLDCGGEGILFIGIDCIGLSNKYVEAIRASLADECRIWGCARVNVYSTHTHAGIDTLGLWGKIAVDGKNDEFMDNLMAAAADAARLAYENRRAGALSYGKARTVNVQRDSRDPQVYDEYLHQFRFAPDDGSGGIRIVSYAAHAEAHGRLNTFVSRDYPGYMADVIKRETGDALLYMPGAIGGLIMTRDFSKDSGYLPTDNNAARTGRCLAEYLMSIPESSETRIAPDMAYAQVKFNIPLDNTVFMLYRILGILDNAAARGGGKMGYSLKTELNVLALGDYTLALIPGEIFPELVYGGYMENAARAEANPAPLCDIARKYGRENLIICGLANDEIGYIIPPNDFVVSDDMPYINKAPGSHYEETNSIGKDAAQSIANAFESALTLLGE